MSNANLKGYYSRGNYIGFVGPKKMKFPSESEYIDYMMDLSDDDNFTDSQKDPKEFDD